MIAVSSYASKDTMRYFSDHDLLLALFLIDIMQCPPLSLVRILTSDEMEDCDTHDVEEDIIVDISALTLTIF